jgi:gluconate 2-dehydrogenase gamma chain
VIRRAATQASQARFFWPEQRKQLEVLFDAILPGTEDSPGATDANAAELIDRLLGAEPASYYEVPAWRRLYVSGLAALDAACRARHHVALAAATPAHATELVADLAAGAIHELPATGVAIDQRLLFGVLRAHCIEGCFADPRWGGNRSSVMWSWYGYLTPAQAFRRGGAP